MKAFRGTSGPESRPAKREYPCVYFAKTMKTAVEYAAGEDSPDPNRGWGYVQEYEIPEQRLLSRSSKEAYTLADEHYGSRVTDSDVFDLFVDPDSRWVKLVRSKGYTGLSRGDDFCTFDNPKAELIGRWRVEIHGKEYVAEPAL